MRAVRVSEYGDSSVLSVSSIPSPEPTDGQVCIDVVFAGVNFADLAKRRGRYPDGPTPPYTPGIEVSGHIADAGTSEFTDGDPVMAYVPRGGYAESVTVDATRVFSVPDGLTLQEAAAVPIQWLTAHNTLFEWGDLTADERVLVHAGAGGVGSAALQLAVAAGATVIATASTSEKRSFTQVLGAEYVIDSEASSDELASRVVDHTNDNGVDLVLDGVGGDAFDASLEALAPAGRIVTYGLASGDVPTVSTSDLFFDNYRLVGYHLGHAVEHQPERVFGALEPLETLFSIGDIRAVVDRTFPLEAASQAHEYVRNRRTQGKVLLEP